MRALLIEADAISARGTELLLRAHGTVVDACETGKEALELAGHYDYDILLLDTGLPDMDGFEAVRRLRAAGIETPILVMSRMSRPEEKVRAFRLGADDFIVKPFETDEFVARVRAVVRRSRGYSQPLLGVGTLQLHHDTRQVWVADVRVAVTGKEFFVLELLVLRKGMIISKEAFLNHLYGGLDEPEVKIIDVYICKLRRKLTEAGVNGLIETVWGRGYMIRTPTVVPSRSEVRVEAQGAARELDHCGVLPHQDRLAYAP